MKFASNKDRQDCINRMYENVKRDIIEIENKIASDISSEFPEITCAFHKLYFNPEEETFDLVCVFEYCGMEASFKDSKGSVREYLADDYFTDIFCMITDNLDIKEKVEVERVSKYRDNCLQSPAGLALNTEPPNQHPTAEYLEWEEAPWSANNHDQHIQMSHEAEESVHRNTTAATNYGARPAANEPQINQAPDTVIVRGATPEQHEILPGAMIIPNPVPIQPVRWPRNIIQRVFGQGAGNTSQEQPAQTTQN